ncbi:hypothetical protein GJV07_15455 [Enterobacteriaceae bacterium RIT711]|nr:hypothetical protein [Enterobacteriaceae bacterium RIT711]
MTPIKIHKQDYPRLCEQFKLGKTHCELAALFGISRERARQILEENGLSGKDGGVSVKAKEKEALKVKKHIKKYGCTPDQLNSLSCHYSQKSKSPLHAFLHQRTNARRRGVEWKLLFWEWWEIWCESGKWERRGRGAGHFCMCRKGDEGAYEKSNVYIDTVVHNSTLGRTLGFERDTKKTFMYRVLTAAGGPALVSREIGVASSYLSQLALLGDIPRVWLTNGKAKKLAELTCGAFTFEQICEAKNLEEEKS